jgi:proteic killer suppression protein
MNKIQISKRARKQIERMPPHIVFKLQKWAEDVEFFGLGEVRMVSGYHDEPLKGVRAGQRSIRLSKSYRAIYVEHDDKIVIEIIEVSKHEY